MSQYTNILATINAQIKANGVGAITGPLLNAVLRQMVSVLGDGYRLVGVAAPGDNPGTPDNQVAYLAGQDGTYTNFGGITLSGEVALLVWGASWSKQSLFSIDSAVTPGSGNPVSSDAVDAALAALAGEYQKLVPTAVEGHLAEFDNAGQVRDAGLATTDLATKAGHYPNLFAGFAGNLVDTRSAGTRQGPFAFRQSSGDGVNYMRKILGRTEAFNQLVSSLDLPTGSYNGLDITNNGDGSYTFSGTTTSFFDRRFASVNVIGGHTYFVKIGIPNVDCNFAQTAFTLDTNGNAITTPANSENRLYITIQRGVAVSGTFFIQVFDLTLEGLGFTTAAAFQSLHPLPYYNYNAGALINNAATDLESTGFNQWDEEAELGAIDDATGENYPSSTVSRSTNYIDVFPSVVYYMKHNAAMGVRLFYYDISKAFISGATVLSVSGTFTTPANCAYIRFHYAGTTYNHDICINLSDPSRNGTYEPYWKRTLALGLNSIPCHDENNNAVVVNGLDGVGSSYDEAVVENGMVTKIIKRRGRRAYQAGDESDATLITDGTNTDYPLATPLTLTVDTPIPALIEVDNLGTEKRLPEDTADNPQGGFESDSNYSVSVANLVRKLSE